MIQLIDWPDGAIGGPDLGALLCAPFNPDLTTAPTTRDVPLHVTPVVVRIAGQPDSRWTTTKPL